MRRAAGRMRAHLSLRPGAAPRLRRDAILFAVLLCAYLALGSTVGNSYYQLMLTLVPLWAAMALAWNLFSGFSGLSSFGHAAFVGVGAYAVAIGAARLGWPPVATIPLGGVLGAVAAVLIGLPTFRLRGHYFALAMLAYPIILLYIMQYLGFQEMPLPRREDSPGLWLQFTDRRVDMLVAAVLLAVCMAISLLVENSRFGLSLVALRQNEMAAEATGLNPRALKTVALAISGALTAVGGGLYACVLLVVTPDAVFGSLVSAQVLVLTLFGGVGSSWGPLIGAAVLIPLSNTLQAELGDRLPGIQGVVYGVAIVGVMLVAPDGVLWTLRDRLGRRRPPAAPVLPASATVPETRRATPRPGDIVLDVAGLSRAFGGLRAVEDVSFGVRRGTILGIIGPNGAGKTTLFNLINGVLAPDRGEVILNGRTLRGRRLFEMARAGIGRTFQVVRAFTRLPVLDNVIVGAYGAGLDGAAALQAATEALDRTGLRDLAGAPAGSLTNKQLRLMELARALASRPEVLLLDETLAGLGREECDEVLRVLTRLRAEGATIVIIEHTMHAMLRIADELLVVDHGQTLARGLPRDVVEDRRVVEAYLGRKWAAKC